MISTKSPAMEETVAILEKLSSDERVRILHESREKARYDELARIHYAMKEGIAKGEKRGIAKGEKRGERSKALDIAKKMLKKGIDVYEVAEISGLSPDEVESLRG
jgi:predicted transposase/invertase (TIGR01784 family)